MKAKTQRQRPRLQIIRGLPGSGKTTLAVKRFANLMRLETDMFFSRKGQYRFTKKLNKEACDWFLDMVDDFCFRGFDFVTTGVFAAHTERLDKVIEAGLVYGYEVYIKTLTTDFGSLHGVPQEHLKAMAEAFVSERELKRRYGKYTRVHFGLMPNRYPLAHEHKH